MQKYAMKYCCLAENFGLQMVRSHCSMCVYVRLVDDGKHSSNPMPSLWLIIHSAEEIYEYHHLKNNLIKIQPGDYDMVRVCVCVNARSQNTGDLSITQIRTVR